MRALSLICLRNPAKLQQAERGGTDTPAASRRVLKSGTGTKRLIIIEPTLDSENFG